MSEEKKTRAFQELVEPEGDLHPEDPTALYREHRFHGPADSNWEKFRRFAHNNKGKVYFLLLVSIVISLGLMMIDRSPASLKTYLANYFVRFAPDAKSWAYSIEGHRVDETHLRTLFPVLLRYSWGSGTHEALKDQALYSEFVRDQFETDIMANAALREGLINRPEARMILENAVRHAVADYYLYSKIEHANANTRPVVSKEEVLALYEKEKDRYEKSGLDRAAALAVIERTLVNMKRDRIQSDLGRVRKQIIQTLKDTSDYRLHAPESK